MSGPERTQRLLGSLRVLVRELEELTGQWPTLAELWSVGVDDVGSRGEPRGELHLVSTASAADLLAWCAAVDAGSGRCLVPDSDPGDPVRSRVTVTAVGRLGELPVRLLAGISADLGAKLGAEWAVWRLGELLSATPAPDPHNHRPGGAR